MTPQSAIWLPQSTSAVANSETNYFIKNDSFLLHSETRLISALICSLCSGADRNFNYFLKLTLNKNFFI